MTTELTFFVPVFLLVALHFLVSGALAAFGIISRMHEDRLFPKDMRGATAPRYMHLGRLHLVIILLALEVTIIPMMLLLVSRFLGWTAGGCNFPGSYVLPLLIVVIVVVVVAVVGFGLASRNPQRFAIWVSYPLFPFYLAFKPVAGLIMNVVSAAFPKLPEELASSFFLISGADEPGEGFIEENGSRLIHSIVEFGAKKVREVMVPRIDVFALDDHTSFDEARVKVSDAGHSRVPVYNGSIDRIVGILYVKDLLRVSPGDAEGMTIDVLMRSTYYVPEGKKIDDLLREFQLEKKHMAVVVDEYGGTSGIVTLEDILEEIVGEIRDEYDDEAPLLRNLGPGEYLIEGRMNLDDLNEALHTSFTMDDVDTLGGFLYNLVEKVPDEGEEIEWKGIRFTIKRLEGQRIADVLLRMPGGGEGER